MALVQLTPTAVTVRLTRGEKVAGLLRDLTVPLAAIRSVDVVHDPLRAVPGLRAPGLSLPGRRKIGTWRRSGERAYVSVRRDQPALRLGLSGQHYSTVLVGTDDAARLAGELAAHLPAGR
jgi:hypothetical protein